MLPRQSSQGKADSVKIASFALAKVIPVYTKAPEDSQYALLQSSAEAVGAAQSSIPDVEKAMDGVFKALMVCHCISLGSGVVHSLPSRMLLHHCTNALRKPFFRCQSLLLYYTNALS